MEIKQKTYSDKDVLDLTERDMEQQQAELTRQIEQMKGKLEIVSIMLTNLRYRRNHLQ